MQIGEFSVPSENVVPKSDLRTEQEIGEFPILTVPQDSRPNDYEAYSVFAEESSKLGFDVTLQVVPRAQQSELAWRTDSPSDGNVDEWWHAAGWNFGSRPSRADPHELLQTVFHPSEQAGYNMCYWEDPEGEYVDALDQQAQTIDREERVAAVNECQEILHERGPIEYLYFQQQPALWNSERWDGFVDISGLGPINTISFSQLEPNTDETHLVTAYPEDDALDPINPWGLNGHTEEILGNIMYERLMWPSAEGGAEPRLATDVEYQDDTTIEISIREGTTFWDGLEVLAEDVKFSYDIHVPDRIQPYSTYYTGAVTPIDEIEIADDYRVIFHLAEPFAPLEINTMARVSIGQKNQWEEIIASDEFEEEGDLGYFPEERPIGSGPLMIPEGETVPLGGNEITLERFDDHWDPVAYERRTSKNIPGIQTTLNQLRAGEVDLLTLYSGSPDIAEQIADENDHLTMETYVGIGHRFMIVNNDNPPGHITAFRRALSHRWDKEMIVRDILDGWAEPAFNHPTSPVMEEFWHDGLEPHAFDIQAAADLLVEDGFLWDEEEHRLHMPEDRWYLQESEYAPAVDLDLERDSLTQEGLSG